MEPANGEIMRDIAAVDSIHVLRPAVIGPVPDISARARFFSCLEQVFGGNWKEGHNLACLTGEWMYSARSSDGGNRLGIWVFLLTWIHDLFPGRY